MKQDKSAHKFGTDSMVLGAWAEQVDAMNILDIGTGTGVLALMMAQKHPEALVDAVEMDKASAGEAIENFENSSWDYRITCYNQTFQDFWEGETLHYDLIICNPPYFEEINKDKGNNTQFPGKERESARITNTLDHKELFDGVSRILVKFGSFYMVGPYNDEAYYTELAEQFGLFPGKRLELKHDSKSNPTRILLCFQKTRQDIQSEEIAINTKEGEWTEEYKALTSEFHQKRN